MSRLASIKEFAEYPMLAYSFSQAAVVISQAQVALKKNANDATTGSLLIVGDPMPYPGSIVAIVANLNTNKTAGVLSVSPTINGVEIASTVPLYRTAMANAALKALATTDAQFPALSFNAADLIGVKLTTDASFLPAASADLLVTLYVVFNYVQP